MKIEELFKFELGMGIQNGQSRIGGRPQLQKKELEFCTMADDGGCTAPRVHEPVGWAISNRFQPVGSVFSRNSSRFQPVGSAMSNRFRKNWTFKIRGDHLWLMVQRFLSLDPLFPCADSWCWRLFQGAGRLHLKGSAAPFPHCDAAMNNSERAGSSKRMR